MSASDWSDWKSAPNFPGIKIRVLCGTYLQSTGNAQWSFQFQNTYSKKVYLVYQEETGDSTGAPPTFSTPGGRNLGPGEKSDVYTDYLRGTCESRKQIFIRIVSISDEQGNQTQAQAGSSRSGAFKTPPQSSSAAGTLSAGSQQGGSGRSASNAAARSDATQSRGVLTPAPAQAERERIRFDDITGQPWVCTAEQLSSAYGDGGIDSVKITFQPGGAMIQGEYSERHLHWVFQGNRWNMEGSTVSWDPQTGFRFAGTVNADNTQITGRWRTYDHSGPLECHRPAS